MKIKARLALEERNSESAQKAAATLSEAGFTITQVGGRGVTFEGEEQQFQQFFHSKPRKQSRGFVFESEPDLPDTLTKVKATVYFPSVPDYFR